METIDHLTLLPTSSNPKNSADWRFLLPILPGIKILMVGQDCDHFTQSFGKLGIEFTKLDDVISNPIETTPCTPSQFDIVLAPLGFSDKGYSSNPLQRYEIYRNLQHLIKPGGTILVGFSNNIGVRFKFNPDTYYSSPVQMKRLLQKTGYMAVRLYGAIPDLSIPDYIFPVTRQAIGFILEHRYWPKLPEYLLPCLYNSIVTAGFSYFLPAYYAIATTPVT